MASRVIQVSDEDLPRLQKAGVRFKDVTERERHLKLTINQLKCDLAGDSQAFSVVPRPKFTALSRVATAARAVPLEELAEKNAREAAALRRLAEELQGLADAQPRRNA